MHIPLRGPRPHDPDASTASSVRSPCSAALAEGSSIESESGAPGLHSSNSAGTLGSLCGDAAPAVGEDLQSLKLTVIVQQERINFLESTHHQVLHQLRTAREELKHEQEKRHSQAGRVLGLEQLMGEAVLACSKGNKGGPAVCFEAAETSCDVNISGEIPIGKAYKLVV